MIATALKEVASELLDALVRAVARMAGGLSRACAMLGIALPAAAGCEESAGQPVERPAVAAVASIDPVALAESVTVAAKANAKRDLGKFHVTFYYVVGEDEVPGLAKRHEHAQVAGPSDGAVLAKGANEPRSAVTLFNKRDCRPIATVSQAFAAQASLQGTGRLRDGRIINVAGHCGCDHSPCFKVTGRKWGTAGNGRPLDPFRTVAVDPRVVKLGSLVYIPALDGVTMPGRDPDGGFKHDGCVGADDTGGGIDGRQLDLFVGKRAFYRALRKKGRGGSHAWARHLRVMDGKGICERKDGEVRKKAAVGGSAI